MSNCFIALILVSAKLLGSIHDYRFYNRCFNTISELCKCVFLDHVPNSLKKCIQKYWSNLCVLSLRARNRQGQVLMLLSSIPICGRGKVSWVVEFFKVFHKLIKIEVQFLFPFSFFSQFIFGRWGNFLECRRETGVIAWYPLTSLLLCF